MGVGLVEQNAPRWERHWDRGRCELKEPTLFTMEQTEVKHSIRVRLNENARVKVGDEVVVSKTSNQVEISSGVSRLGRAVQVPSSVSETLSPSKSAIGTVSKLHEYSNSVEIIVK